MNSIFVTFLKANEVHRENNKYENPKRPGLCFVKLCTFVANITINGILSIADIEIKEFVWVLLERVFLRENRNGSSFFKLTTLKVIAD